MSVLFNLLQVILVIKRNVYRNYNNINTNQHLNIDINKIKNNKETLFIIFNFINFNV